MKKLLFLILFIPSLALGNQQSVTTQIMTACDMSTSSCTSTGVQTNLLSDVSIQAVFTGSPVGTFKLQVSNDNVPAAYGSNPCGNNTNWTDLTGSSQAISASGNFGWDYALLGYRCIRLVYTKTSGTGTANATLNGKGL